MTDKYIIIAGKVYRVFLDECDEEFILIGCFDDNIAEAVSLLFNGTVDSVDFCTVKGHMHIEAIYYLNRLYGCEKREESIEYFKDKQIGYMIEYFDIKSKDIFSHAIIKDKLFANIAHARKACAEIQYLTDIAKQAIQDNKASMSDFESFDEDLKKIIDLKINNNTQVKFNTIQVLI